MDVKNAENIIKALEQCSSNTGCGGCMYRTPVVECATGYVSCVNTLLKDATEVIKSLVAENERLKDHNAVVSHKRYNDGIIDFADMLITKYADKWGYIETASFEVSKLANKMTEGN